MIIDAHRLSWVYHVIYMVKDFCGMCLHGSYINLLSWQVGRYNIWHMMLVVSLHQLKYFQMENILFSNVKGVLVSRCLLGTLDTYPM